MAVAQGKAWLPLTDQLRYRECVNRPTVDKIAIEVVKMLEEYEKSAESEIERKAYHFTAKCLKKRASNKQFLLTLLSTLNPGHRFFTKEFVVEKEVDKQEGEQK